MDIISEIAIYLFTKARYMFLLVTPWECMYPDIKVVPRYVVEIFPFFVILGLLENAVIFFKTGKIFRINDNIASISQGIFQECLRLKVRSIEVIVYCFVYDNYRIHSLPWDSVWTWYICFVAIDLGFYWAHRIAHEVNIIWAIHQAHHSAEDFVVSSALRQAVLQPFTAWMTYVPLALFIPPSIFLAHLQLGELYMFWIHTEVIDKLGPLEYILNTPSHHRVHHGRNPKYIDKNYAGTFIIWDKMFGTFEAEDPNEPVVYGLVHPVRSYNPWYLQGHHWVSMFKRIFNEPSWKNKFLIPFMGPGWEPGKPRLGLVEDIPKVEYPVELFDPKIPLWQQAYVVWHFALTIIFYHELTVKNNELGQFTVTCCILALLTTITSIGFLLEKRWFAPILEFIRCSLYYTFYKYIRSLIDNNLESSNYYEIVDWLIKATFSISTLIFGIYSLSIITSKVIYSKGFKSKPL